MTPLHVAAEGGHLEVCQLFINAKKRDPNSHEMIDRLEDKNPRSEEGKTPLDFATIAVHLNLRQFNIENAEEDRKDTSSFGCRKWSPGSL